MLRLIIISIMLLIASSTVSYAKEIPFTDENCIRAIIGEAANQGFEGMLDLASGIRNRGSLKGVYGLNAKHVDKQPKWVWKQARKAWSLSKRNRTHIGTHWENINAFGTPFWAKSMKKVHEYKDHVFYREK